MGLDRDLDVLCCLYNGIKLVKFKKNPQREGYELKETNFFGFWFLM